MLNARYESLAVASSSPGKFDNLGQVVRDIGMGAIDLTWLPISNGLPEPVKRNPKDVGREKMEMFAPNIDIALGKLCTLPQYVTIMDVLAVVKRMEWLDDSAAVMKKPEEGSALTAFSSFFAMCGDEMRDHGMEELELAYYLIHAKARVDIPRKRVEITPKKSIEVGYDRIDFFLSSALVTWLSDPDLLKQAAREGLAVGEVLTTQSIVGFKIQNLVPAVVDIAAKEQNDGLMMRVKSERGGWEVQVDRNCDLGQRVESGVQMSNQTNHVVKFQQFLVWAAKNVTPWLVNNMYTDRRVESRSN